MTQSKMRMIDARHPSWVAESSYWAKWRAVAEGGDEFVETYLQRNPDESQEAFDTRVEITPPCGFAKTALYEIISAFLVRLPDVVRNGGPSTYTEACIGKNRGVDRLGSTMNQFMALDVLKELLICRRVGVFVDREHFMSPVSIADANMNPPYLYVYPAEDILAWTTSPDVTTPTELLLRRYEEITIEGSTLVVGQEISYLHLKRIWFEPEILGTDVPRYMVRVQAYDSNGTETYTLMLDIPQIPFVLLEVNHSIIKDAAGYQIALLNVDSANVSFSLASSLSVYTEQQDMATFMAAMRRPIASDDEGDTEDEDLSGVDGNVHTVRLGNTRGRRYLQNSERPGFISPDNVGLSRTQALSEGLKTDIRRVMMLSVANLATRGNVSATAMELSLSSANNGLSSLGATLERAERTIAEIWGLYEAKKPATVQYPVDFQVLTDAERREAIKELVDIRDSVPSATYQKELTFRIASLMLAPTATRDTMTKVRSEIEQAPGLISKIEDVVSLVEASIMPREYAAASLCLPTDAAEKANAEHADRLARIAASQESNDAARGNSDGAGEAGDEKELSQDPDSAEDGSKAVRS